MKQSRVGIMDPNTNPDARGRRSSIAAPSQINEFGGKSKTTIKPANQLQLTPEELKEEFTRVLTAVNPQAPKNQVQFSNNALKFVSKPCDEGTLILFTQKGYLLDVNSPEAQCQIRMDAANAPPPGGANEDGADEQNANDESREGDGEIQGAGEPKATSDDAEAVNVDQSEEAGEAEKPAEDGADNAEGMPGPPKKKLPNAFNFCERASQTMNQMLKEAAVETQPPPRSTLSSNVNAWSIYDTYQSNFEQQQQEKLQAQGKAHPKPPAPKPVHVSLERKDEQEIIKVSRQSRTVERIVNQNTYDEIAQDFKYYEDASDEFKEKEGTVLPLWRFSFDPVKKLAVTDICWSETYSDLFAATFGSYNFLGQSYGQVCLYSLKNPTYPEYHLSTSSGVMCVDIHQTYPHLVCIGMYNGTVSVLSLQTQGREPVCLSKTVKGRHADSVNKVRWGPDNMDGNHNFYSVSADGRVINWQLVQSELRLTEVTSLGMPEVKNEGPDGTVIPVRGCGSTFAFHRTDPSVFLVGTEEGNVYRCSTTYSSSFLSAFSAHMQSIYSISWNFYHTGIFATCSADWTVKIWQQDVSSPLFVFDLAAPVGDVAWAPYSSTVFAASTIDGRIHIFDLDIDKYRPICCQAVIDMKKTRMTRVSFSLAHPIVLVGDERGNVTSLKLSPNLRKKPKEAKNADAKRLFEIEQEKIEKLLSIVREPAA
ncbi:dynein intermediate chain 2, ciliary-like [Amphibalanus amphitrite]|uniref:dynein intermediate chain 2, ciliary-like n=1 Tax=Amphibalanus amphitrite TaxID=1232801 RepID=UPI001C905790|nr:dynein intermediate chain 2, ciliary-like [Amphibalanus amphitrite]